MYMCFWSGSIKVLAKKKKNKIKQYPITSTFRRKQPGMFCFPSDECLFCLLVGQINSLAYKTKLVSSWKSSPPSSCSSSLKEGMFWRLVCWWRWFASVSLFHSCNLTGYRTLAGTAASTSLSNQPVLLYFPETLTSVRTVERIRGCW